MDVRCALYRYFDAEGALLYVGVAVNPKRRDADHSKTEWHSEHAVRTMTWFATRTEALAAEAVAIREEHPVHNITGTGRPRRRRPRPQRLPWTIEDLGRGLLKVELPGWERSLFVNPQGPDARRNADRMLMRLGVGEADREVVLSACGLSAPGPPGRGG